MSTTKIIHAFYACIFGGDGDLAMRKIYPALFHRFIGKQLVEQQFQVIVVVRNKWEREQFLKKIQDFILITKPNEQAINRIDAFFNHFKLIEIPQHEEEYYAPLKTLISNNKDWQRIFYLSTPSAAFGEIVTKLNDVGLIHSKSKVVVEKPLGYDLKSSKVINDQLANFFKEDQIYRIDHYLGKETVQNLMVLRFANHLFEYSWNSYHIDSIHITVAESLGVESRANYYDQSGALLDMVQNHLLQLVCLIAMEPPANLEADSVRIEKLKVLQSLRPIDESTIQNHTVRGQYTRGKTKAGEVPSYLEDISAYVSNTETFVALKTYIDNWRWVGVPFYLRTGKRMPRRYSEIVINYKTVSHNVFSKNKKIPGNKLIIRLQPEERIELVQMTKIPGPGGYRYKPISLKLDYLDSFKERLPDAYERLLIDILRGEQTLFMSRLELEASWIWIETITKNWSKLQMKNMLYEAGSEGPGDHITEPGHEWNLNCTNYDDK